MTNTIEVTGCKECPFEYYALSNTRYCVHPEINADGVIIGKKEILPECPLKQSSILIALKTKDNGE